MYCAAHDYCYNYNNYNNNDDDDDDNDNNNNDDDDDDSYPDNNDPHCSTKAILMTKYP